MNGETRTRSVGTTCSWSQRSLTWLTHGSAISRSRNAKKTANDLPAKAVTLEVFSKGLGFRELCLKQSPSSALSAVAFYARMVLGYPSGQNGSRDVDAVELSSRAPRKSRSGTLSRPSTRTAAHQPGRNSTPPARRRAYAALPKGHKEVRDRRSLTTANCAKEANSVSQATHTGLARTERTGTAGIWQASGQRTVGPNLSRHPSGVPRQFQTHILHARPIPLQG